MKKLTGLNAPIKGLDGKPVGDLAAGRLIADAIFACRDTKLPVRMHKTALAVYEAKKELELEDQDYEEALRIVEEADFPVISKGIVLACFGEIVV